MTRRVFASTVILSASLWAACTSASDGAGGVAGAGDRVLRGADRYPDEGLIVVKADLNNDRIPDVLSVYREQAARRGEAPTRALLRKEVDVNFDGAADVWRHYGPGEELLREELDYSFDGRVDAVHHYEQGQLVRKEIDIEFDQAPDVFKYYQNNELIRVERDTNNDGRIDYWEYYERGLLDRVGRDNNGDGRVDTWQER